MNLAVFGRPDVIDLEFASPYENPNSSSVVLSRDEQITMDVFEKTRHSVVNIAATTLTMNFWLQVIPRQGQGTGFIIDDEGYILTNNHVVGAAQKITVTMENEHKVSAVLIGRDSETDLAVIKIPRREVPMVAELGNSDFLRVGQKAIAIGNPFGLSHTLTTGIISAMNRELQNQDGSVLYDLIQTDAAINPGNSGGPLLNSNGQVIGINTAIYSLSGGYQGIGFAIPVNRARKVATQLITSGRFSQPWLGISGLALSKGLSEVLGIDIDEGVLVVNVLRGSPAENVGIRGGNRDVVIQNVRVPLGGDVILSIDQKKIGDMKELIREIGKRSVGDTIDLTLWRDNNFEYLAVTLEEKTIRE